MDKMISTKALHGDYLAHARVYSHKYIKREPNGHGGWVYTYPTDASITRKTLFIGRRGTPSHWGKMTSTLSQYKVGSNGRLRTLDDMNTRNLRDVDVREGHVTAQQHYREADKASQIYKEGLSENNAIPVKQNIAQQTISTITTSARNTYEAGMNFLKKLFSTPIITTKKNITVTETRGELRNPRG